MFLKLQTTLDCKKKTSTSPNSRERPLIRKTGWGTYHRKRERGREDAVFYEKGGKKPDYVENVDRRKFDLI